MSQIQLIQSGLENIDYQKQNGTTYTFSAEYLKNKRKRMAIDNVYRQKDNTLNVGFILLKQGTIKNDLLIIDLDRDIGQAVFNTSFWIDYSDVARLGLVFYATEADQLAARNPFYWDNFLLRNGNESLYIYSSITTLNDINMKIVVDAMTPENKSYVDHFITQLSNGVVQLDIKYFNMSQDVETLKTRVNNLNTNVDNPPYISLGNSAVFKDGATNTGNDINFRYSMYNIIYADRYKELISDTINNIEDWTANPPRFSENIQNYGHNNGLYANPSGNITSFKPFTNSGSIMFEKTGRYLVNVKWSVTNLSGQTRNIVLGTTHIFLNNKDLGINNADSENWVVPKLYHTFTCSKIIKANVNDVLRVAVFIKNDLLDNIPFLFDSSKQLIEIHYLGS